MPRRAPKSTSKDPLLAVRRRDDAFWEEQENRLTKQLGQPCCSLSGMTSLLVGMPGNFAVVIHGEVDCVNCFVHTQGPSSDKFYSTRVSQLEFTTGKTKDKLRRCLELIIKLRSPEAVFVMGNCSMEMIHDEFDVVAAEVSEDTGVPVLPLRTHGLKAGPQAHMVDWLYSTLAALARPKPPGKSKRVNLIGMPELSREGVRTELQDVLGAAGLTLNGSYPFEAELRDWQNLGNAGMSFVVDKSIYPMLLKRLKALGLPSVEVPLPVGLGPTRKLLRRIGKSLGAEKKLDKAAAPLIARVRARLKAFRARFGGMRVAIGLRMVNNYEADQLAYDGMGDITFFVEAGFRPTVFIQGPPEERAHRHFRERLDQLGCRLPFHIFPDPYDLPPLLKGGRFDVAYMAGHASGEARKAGVPLIRGRSLEPLFEGAVRNLDFLEAVLGGLRGGRK